MSESVLSLQVVLQELSEETQTQIHQILDHWGSKEESLDRIQEKLELAREKLVPETFQNYQAIIQAARSEDFSDFDSVISLLRRAYFTKKRWYPNLNVFDEILGWISLQPVLTPNEIFGLSALLRNLRNVRTNSHVAEDVNHLREKAFKLGSLEAKASFHEARRKDVFPR